MKVYFSFEELSLIGAICGSRENVIERLTEIKANSEQDIIPLVESSVQDIIPLVESSVEKLKSITDEDFASLDYSETEVDYAR